MKFIYPIDRVYITQYFGANPAYYKKYGMKGHNGLDFRTRFLTPLNDMSPLGKRYVVSMAKGKVSEVILTPGSGYGNHVKVTHEDGSTMTYAHLQKSYVYKGQQVNQGQRIALTDNTGDSTAPHLHITYKPPKPKVDNGYGGAENPLPLIKK